MTKMTVCRTSFLVLAGVLALAPMVAAQSSSQAGSKDVTITGQVSCSRFGGGSVSARKGMSIAQTIWYCATFQNGDYTLVSGKQIFRLTGDGNLLAKMAGKTVTVTGRLYPVSPDVANYALMSTVAVANLVPTKQ